MTRGIGMPNPIPILGITPAVVASVEGLTTRTQGPWADSGGSRTYTDSDYTAETTANTEANFVNRVRRSGGLMYVELQAKSAFTGSPAGDAFTFGVDESSSPLVTSAGNSGVDGFGWQPNSTFRSSTSSGGTISLGVLPSFSAVSSGDVFQIAINFDDAKAFFAINNDWGTQDPATGTNPVLSGFSVGAVYVHARTFYTGDQIGITNPVIYMPPVGFDVWGAT